LAPLPKEGGRPPPPPIGLEGAGEGEELRPPPPHPPTRRHGPPRHCRWRRAHPRPCSTRLAWPRSTLPHLAVARSLRRGSSTERRRCWPGADHERLPLLEEEQGSHGQWWRPSRPPLCVTAGARGGGARCALLRDNAPAQEGGRGRPLGDLAGGGGPRRRQEG
jgi:hypothetical protein